MSIDETETDRFEVEPVNAAVQVALQTLGIGVLVGLGSLVVRRFW